MESEKGLKVSMQQAVAAAAATVAAAAGAATSDRALFRRYVFYSVVLYQYYFGINIRIRFLAFTVILEGKLSANRM